MLLIDYLSLWTYRLLFSWQYQKDQKGKLRISRRKNFFFTSICKSVNHICHSAATITAMEQLIARTMCLVAWRSVFQQSSMSPLETVPWLVLVKVLRKISLQHCHGVQHPSSLAHCCICIAHQLKKIFWHIFEGKTLGVMEEMGFKDTYASTPITSSSFELDRANDMLLIRSQ